MEVARSECETNKAAYPTNPYYQDLIDQLDGGVQRLRDVDNIRGSFSKLRKYSGYIKNMKYLRRWNRLNRSVETSVMSHTFVVASLALITACIEVSRRASELPADLTYRAILRALFHDVPETFTGDVITPVKKRIAVISERNWREIEQRRLQPLIEAAPPEVQHDIEALNLLSDLPSNDNDVFGKLVKECDQLASLLECVFERSAGRTYGEMDQAYDAYAKTLLSSSWRSIREIALYGLFRKGEEEKAENKDNKRQR